MSGWTIVKKTGSEKSQSSSSMQVKLIKGTSLSLLSPKCQTTGTDLDILITDSEGNGGIPIGVGKITLLAGEAGSGKTRTLTNLAAKVIHKGYAFLYIGFEFEAGEFAHQVDEIHRKLYREPLNMDKLYMLDYYRISFRKGQIKQMCSQINEFYMQTKSPFVVIDSITEMAKMETMLRNTMDELQQELIKINKPLALIGVSQFRGSWEGNIAGGKGILHKATAVIVIEKVRIDNFIKNYFPEHRHGEMVRLIFVEKTANYAHDIQKHVFEIDETGAISITREPLKKVYIKEG